MPRDISVIGFDDIQMAQFTDPPLTTIRLARAAVAASAFEALLSGWGEDHYTGSERHVATTLVIRESAACRSEEELGGQGQ